MGEKIIFRYHKMYNLRLYRQKSSYLCISYNKRTLCHVISSSFTYTNNIRKFNLIIKIERSSDLNALFLFI